MNGEKGGGAGSEGGAPVADAADAGDPRGRHSVADQALVDRINRSDRWMIGLTAAIALCGLASAIVFWQQLCVMQGQLDEMRQSFAADRAYLLNGGFTGYGAADPSPQTQVGFTFTNFGRTPAEVRSIGGSCLYSISGLPRLAVKVPIPGLTDEVGRIPTGVVVAADRSVGPFKYTLEASAHEIEQARGGNGRLYCRSIVTYDDMRDKSHGTGVCFFYNFSVRGFMLGPGKNANYHT